MTRRPCRLVSITWSTIKLIPSNSSLFPHSRVSDLQAWFTRARARWRKANNASNGKRWSRGPRKRHAPVPNNPAAPENPGEHLSLGEVSETTEPSSFVEVSSTPECGESVAVKDVLSVIVAQFGISEGCAVYGPSELTSAF